MSYKITQRSRTGTVVVADNRHEPHAKPLKPVLEGDIEKWKKMGSPVDLIGWTEKDGAMEACEAQSA